MKKTLAWLNQRVRPTRRWIMLLSLITSVAAARVREERFKQIETDIRVLQSREVRRSQERAGAVDEAARR